MKTKIQFSEKNLTEKQFNANSHYLLAIDKEDKNLPFHGLIAAKLSRSQKKFSDLSKGALQLDLPNGALLSVVMLASEETPFNNQTKFRKALAPLLSEKPKQLNLVFYGKINEVFVSNAIYVSLVNAQTLISMKKPVTKFSLTQLNIFGCKSLKNLNFIESLVEGNTLTRDLTMTPPNSLTPTLYRKEIKKFARANKLVCKEFTMPQLKKMGAGAFYAVGQGSEPQDAAIVHLTYHPRGAKKNIALVGKGICFDTGGHNLKPAKYMSGMHEDMNGSAVALGILHAAVKAKLNVKIDCWLAIAQNHIGPKAYKQNDVVTALNGLNIEIVHTDAEGRMVLADTLTLASRKKPDAIIDFATLTGCMAVAMGDRYSGVISNRPELACMAVGAGADAGERIAAFPYDEDYEEDIESQIADIKQCTLEGGPDHIHAGRFLGRFVENNVPWLHVDLSSSNRKGGLGAVSSDVNGFGVGFGLKMIQKLLAKN